MKKFWEIMNEDIKQHDFTKSEKIVYGIIIVVVLFVLMGVAGWMDTLI